MKGDFMRQTALVATLLVFGSAAFAADSQLMSLVMPDAKVLAGMNVTNARVSPFGQYFISKASQLSTAAQPLIAATGFDPFQDVTEVLAASTGTTSKPAMLVLVRGNFNVDKITALIGARSGVLVEPYDGSTLVKITNAGATNTQAVAFIGNSIAVGGNLPDVQAAVDRNGGAVTIDPALAAQANQLSATEDEWLTSSTPVASLIPADTGVPASGPAAQMLPILKSIQSFGGGVVSGANIQIMGQAVTNSPQNGAALGAVLQLALNLASMGAANNTQLAPLTQFLQTLQVSANGAAVTISASIPESQVETLFNQALKKAIPAPAAIKPASARIN
jgi:hypothetical protein